MLKALIKDIKKHHLQYLILGAGLSVGILGIFTFESLVKLRIFFVIFLSFFYFCWGIIHHLLAGDWHLKIALEYFFISLIGGILLISLILRG